MFNKEFDYAFVYKELRRKFFHLILGLILTLYLYFFYPKSIVVSGVILILGLILSILVYFDKIHFLDTFLYYFEREEKIPGRGALTLFLGILIPFIFFEKNIALIAALAVSIVDSTATIIGIFLEKKYDKSLTASFIGGLMLFVILSSFFSIIRLELAIIGSITASIIEFYSKKKDFLDDNIFIGVGTAIITWLFKIFLL